MAISRSFIILAATMISLVASADNSCTNWLAGESTSILSQQKLSRENGETERAGVILAPGQKFDRNWQSGVYIYVMTTDGYLVFANRVADGMSTTDILNSHRSLVREFVGQTNRNPDIAAAGEFRIENDRVTTVNNASGTFRGGPSHLQIALAELKVRGLPIETQTELLDYSDETIGHAQVHMTAFQIARATHLVRRYPVLVKKADRLRDVYSRLAKVFPNPKKPGLAKGILNGVDFVAMSRSGRSDELTVTIHVLNMIEEAGIEFATNDIARVLRSDFSNVSFDQVIRFLESILSENQKQQEAERSLHMAS